MSHSDVLHSQLHILFKSFDLVQVGVNLEHMISFDPFQVFLLIGDQSLDLHCICLTLNLQLLSALLYETFCLLLEFLLRGLQISLVPVLLCLLKEV